MLVDAPALVEAELRQHELRIGEEPAALAEGGPCPGVSEAHDVSLAISGDVGEEAGMPVDEPSPRSVPVGALLDSAEVTSAK